MNPLIDNKKKTLKIMTLLTVYLIMIGLVVSGFAFTYMHLDTKEDPKLIFAEEHQDRVFNDYFYFSGITYLTIGYGDIYPTENMKIIVLIEGVIGLIINGVFIGILIYFLQQRGNYVLFYNKIIITERNNEFSIVIPMKNFGDLLISIERGIELGYRINNKYEYRKEVNDRRNYFRKRLRMGIKSIEHPETFKFIQEILRENKKFEMRCFLKGTNGKNGEIHVSLMSENLNFDDIIFANEVEVVSEIKRNFFIFKDYSVESNFKITEADLNMKKRFLLAEF